MVTAAVTAHGDQGAVGGHVAGLPELAQGLVGVLGDVAQHRLHTALRVELPQLRQDIVLVGANLFAQGGQVGLGHQALTVAPRTKSGVAGLPADRVSTS